MCEMIRSQAGQSVGKDAQGVFTRLLGPTADIMGAQLAQAYQNMNVSRTVRKAERKVRSSDPGAIPPRVAQGILDSAQWADNEFVSEYLSGVLASARSEGGEDDRGVSWNALVERLSSDQLALHWMIYVSVHKRISDGSIDHIWDLTKRQLVFDVAPLFQALSWRYTRETLYRLYDAAYGLSKEDLIADLSHGQGDYLRDGVVWTRGRKFSPNRHYVTLKVTHHGVGLFLQLLGYGKHWYDVFFDPGVSQAIEEMNELPNPFDLTFVLEYPKITQPTTKG